MEETGRRLSEEQKYAVETLFKRNTNELYPLYIKFIFDITKNWSSFISIEEQIELKECDNINKAIDYIFKAVENDYGQMLVSKCLFYLTLSGDSGISDNELEDVLSLDDELLEYSFKKQKSPIQRFPIALWHRVKFHLKDYLTLKQVDETQVYSW